ncbi:hypothetical protein DSL64_04545 [Dyadobacter luteus]|uniref:Lipoprotein n=1 Tax=Dyadobacter luteus TaxID=2259619 RepID=A0A3D8YGA3_9BACT|nr:hypothetical protein [Dyadobacter luteus]REA63707.1 hypothetical protein DSL64_04545 [Dyadobacter luteus]
MRYFLLLALIIFSACKKPETEADLLASIETVRTEIQEMIRPRNCVTFVDDCRIRDIMSGHGCGPTYIYNVKDVNTSKLDRKFAELEKLYRRYNEIGEKIQACYRIVPNTPYIKDGKCKAEFRMPGQ